MKVATPVDYWRAGIAIWSMMAEAQAVITLRCLGMVGLWTAPPGEAARMVLEKQRAFAQSGRAAMAKAAAGGGPEAVAHAAVRPLGRVTAANVARLRKAGPRKPRT
ncbi:antifreeze protein [Plastorhodobacter daqingensis]|uniref:Antifreeze protein n=1 Tax=Plastorhodobacter daqingensis TaxID=1387281 RepID=A0ABW2UIJ6_9RHOB